MVFQKTKIITYLNIFIAHTPLQNFIAGSIAKQFLSDKIKENVLITSVPNSDLNYFSYYHNLEPKGFFSKIWSVLKAKRRVKKLLNEGSCNLFIPHTGALLDNYFYYNYPVIEKGNTINFYYEGLLYFYEYREPYKRKTHLYRKIFGLLFGLRYQYNEVIFPAKDGRISSIYTILPEYTLGDQDKMKRIDIRQYDYRGDKKIILILGGKPSLLDDSEVIELYREMLKVVLDQNNDTILLFKGHHADYSLNFQKANADQLRYKDITQNKPIEEVIELYNPGLILSYPSSGLINLKQMYGPEIEMNCYYTANKRKHVVKFENIFDELDIRIRFI